MARTIEFEVSHGQLVVFDGGLSLPFNDWTDQHVAQGFAWRPGSVSFRTMSESGLHRVDILTVDQLGAVHPNAVRAIEVPFEVPIDNSVEVGSITETAPITLQSGSYLLRCEFLQSSGRDGERVRLIFAKGEELRFSIVRADPELMVDDELMTTAQPALS